MGDRVLIVLPLAAWLLGFGLVRTLPLKDSNTQGGWRATFLSACLLWGLALTAITEIMGNLHWLTFGAVVISWLSLCLLMLVITLARLRGVRLRLRPIEDPLSTSSRVPLSGVGLIVLLTGLTAIIAPPNTWDSLNYHMSRVMHWIQNRSVDFYATHIVWQLLHPPWAEYAILHLQILSGGDRFANLVQWFSMLGSLIGVTAIVRELGGSRESQVYAMVFGATIPMGILQSSSTQNDYVVSFWLICLAYFVLRLKKTGSRHYAVGAGASLGLAFLTKGTAYLFGWPFLLWLGLSGLRARRVYVWKSLAVIAIVALTINTNHYRRNFDLFGSPLGPAEADRLGQGFYANEKFGLRVTALNVAKNISLHLGTPFEQVNRMLEGWVAEFASILGLDVNDPAITFLRGSQFRISKLSTFEDLAGNPVHLGLILWASVVCLAAWRPMWRANADRLGYLATLFLGFVTFATYSRWQIWGSRLHLPLFVLASPVVGLVLASSASCRIRSATASVLLMTSIPWVLANQTRPLVAWPGFTPFPSILTSSRSDAYFNADPTTEEPFRLAASLIANSGCSNVGLAIGHSDPEYLLWILLREASRLPRIEHVDFDWDRPTNPSHALAGQFRPCAIFHIWFDDRFVPKYMAAVGGGKAHQFGVVYVIVQK